MAVAGFLLLLQGCGTYTEYKVSRPEIVDKDSRNNQIGLPDLDLNIQPYNAVKTFERWNSIVFLPVYISTKEERWYKEQETFAVMLSYRPHQEGFSLDPQKVRLIIEGDEFNSNVVQQWKDPLIRRGKRWTPYCRYFLPEGYHRIDRDPVSKKDTENWHCFKLHFDVEPPDTSQRFAIAIDGMKKGQAKYEIPVIWFEEYERAIVDSVP